MGQSDAAPLLSSWWNGVTQDTGLSKRATFNRKATGQHYIPPKMIQIVNCISSPLWHSGLNRELDIGNDAMVRGGIPQPRKLTNSACYVAFGINSLIPQTAPTRSAEEGMQGVPIGSWTHSQGVDSLRDLR